MADPNQVFIISAISRKQIAEDLNEFLDEQEVAGDRLTPDDDRLTPELCREYADSLYYVDRMNEQEVVDETMERILHKIGFKIN